MGELTFRLLFVCVLNIKLSITDSELLCPNDLFNIFFSVLMLPCVIPKQLPLLEYV